MMERLKKKWGIESTLQIVVIMVVFSLAGMGITAARNPLFHFLGLTPEKPLWLKIIAYLVFVFPMYQAFLLIFGTLLGQFRFFWEKEKKMVQWIGRKLTGTPAPAPRTCR